MNQEKNDRQNKRHLIIFSVFFIAILVIITLLTRYSKNPEELGAENSNNEKVVFQEEESVNDVGEGKEEEEEETTEEVDTSNWLTYRNEEYGFEVRYPEGWEVFEPTKDVRYYKTFLAVSPINREKKESQYIRFGLINKSNQLEAEAFFLDKFNKNDECFGGVCSLFVRSKPYSITTRNKIKIYEFKVGGVVGSRYAILEIENKIFILSSLTEEPKLQEIGINEIFDRMLENLIFLET